MRLSTIRLWARPYRWRLAAIGGLGIVTSGFTLLLPWLAGQALGGVLGDGASALSASVAALVVVLVLATALSVAGTILSAATSGHIVADLRLATHTHIHRLPMTFHDRSRSGELLSLSTFEVSHLAEFLSGTLARVPATLLTAGGAAILLHRLSPSAGLFIIALVPICWIGAKLFGRRLRTLGQQAREADAALIVLAEQQFQMLAATKSFAQEDRQHAAFARLAQEARRMHFAQARLTAVTAPTFALVAGLAVIGMILLADRTTAQTDSASLFSLMLYAALLARPVGSLIDLYGQFQWVGGTFVRLEAVLAEAEELGYHGVPAPARARGAIAFEEVNFAYPGRKRTIDGVSLAIAPGEIVALTGENGGGKSTLISLLQGFYRPSSGRITLDGKDIGTLQLQDLRRQIGLVPQNPRLFAGTVRENIIFGRPGASDAEIARALELAQGGSLLAILPQGLDTRIGDDGVRLSGGQRQRVALARALLVDPPVLVFDEATSMFDLEAESAFVAACKDALAGRTAIIVTHRPASLALADRIVEFEDGRICGITVRG